jgi:nitroreductase
MQTFLELVKARYSVRSFKPQPIKPEELAQVLEAGRVAPTACNNQPQRIKVITDRAELAKVDECTPCRFGALTVLLVCYDRTVCWKRVFDGAASGEIDASIVTTHLILAAQEAGLGACWVMYFDPAKTIELFALPPNIIPVAMLPIGYPAEDAVPAAEHDQRFSINTLLLK